MKSVIYSDYDNPVVIEKAKELTKNADTIEEKLNALFLYVRDGILFGFNEEGDFIKASEIIKKGTGQCNNKAVLFLALVRALDFKARIHFSTIDIEIQYGIFPWWALAIFPKYISHSWVEVYYKGRWVNIDAFINDEYFYNAGKSLLRKQERKLGYSIACTKGESGIDLNLENEVFVQMDAVTGDLGIYDDPGEHFHSKEYKNRPNWFTYKIYLITMKMANKKVKELRKLGYSCCAVKSENKLIAQAV